MKQRKLALAIVLTPLVWSVTPARGRAPVLATQSAGRQSEAAQKATAAFREGYAAFERNDLAAARLAFEKVVRLQPGVAAGHTALGTVLLAAGDAQAAIRELEAAQKLDPHDRTALLNLSVAYSHNRAYAESVKAFHAFQQGIGKDAEAAIPAESCLAIAKALSATQSRDEAASLLIGALQREPQNAALHDALGTLQAQQKQLDAAESQFRQAIAISDRLAIAHFHLGSLALETGRKEEAVRELTAAHTLDEDNTGIALQLAQALEDAREDDAAIQLLRQLLEARETASEKAPNDPAATADVVEIKYRLALALQAAGQMKDSLSLFQEVLKARPKDAEALTNTALAYVQLGDAKTGIPLYLKALAITPANATLRQDLGVAYLQQSDLDHALEQFRAGLALDKDNPQLHYDLGLALKLKDDYAGAIPEFEKAESLDPSLPDPPYTLGILYMQAGRFSDAAASLERATALRPDNGDAWSVLGNVYRQLEQPDKAAAALRKAIALLPQQPSPHITLAAILAAQGKRDEAAQERKIGADLTRVAVSRQKANFALDSGTLLLKRGQTEEALKQFESAVAADPRYAAAHTAYADALERAGRQAEAAEERRKAKELE